jgi:hypothetical protein
MVNGLRVPRRPWAGFLKSIFMTKQERDEFLSKPCEDNITWAAQEIAALNSDRRYQITIGLKRLNEVLYKSWAKELTLRELLEAMEMIK